MEPHLQHWPETSKSSSPPVRDRWTKPRYSMMSRLGQDSCRRRLCRRLSPLTSSSSCTRAAAANVIPAFYVLTPGELHHQNPVHRGYCREVEGLRLLTAGKRAAHLSRYSVWSEPSAAHWTASLRYSLSASGVRGLMRQKEIAHLVYRLLEHVL